MGAQALSSVDGGGAPTALDDSDNRLAVITELQKVLSHTTFRDTKRLKRFLEYVVMETLDGRGARLKGYSLGIEVFDRSDDFDPQGDTIVRVQAGQLRRRLDLYYAKDGLADPIRILLPKGRYEPVFEFRREIAAKEEQSRKVISLNVKDSLARPGILVPSILNLSGDDSYKYFAEGLTSEIVNALVQFRYLRIITGTPMIDTTTAMTNKDVARIYNAQFVLSGSVRRSKDVMRVSVNFINAETGAHLLTKTIDRQCTPDTIFEIQEEIASYVAAALATSNGAVNRYNRRLNAGRIANMMGYDALLRFFDIRSEYNDVVFLELISEFENILEETPSFSSGWAAQSLLYSSLVGNSYASEDPKRLIELALDAAYSALDAHSENALAYHASSMAHFFAGNFDRYERDAAASIALNPNDYTTLLRYAKTRFCLGDFEGARTYDAAAHTLMAIPTHWNISVKYALEMMAGNYALSSNHLRSMTQHSNPGTLIIALACAGHAGDSRNIAAIKDQLLAVNANYFEDLLIIFKRWHPQPEIFEKVRLGFEKANLVRS